MKKIGRKIISILLAFSLVFVAQKPLGYNEGVVYSASAANGIITREQAVEWVRGLIDCETGYDGKSLNVDNTWGFQCVDLVTAYMNFCYFSYTNQDRSPFGSYASNGYNTHNAYLYDDSYKYDSDWTVIERTSNTTPMPGDIFVTEPWTDSNGNYHSVGHVGIITDVYSNTSVRVIEMNNSYYGKKPSNGQAGRLPSYYPKATLGKDGFGAQHLIRFNHFTEGHIHDYNYSSSIITAPTRTKDGVRRKVCSCGESYQDEIIPAINYVSIPDGIYAIKSKVSSTWVTGHRDNNTVYIFGSEEPTIEMEWHFTRNSDGTYEIENVNRKMFLGVSNNSMMNEGDITLQTRSFTDAQKFYFVLQDDGWYRIVNKMSYLSIDLQYANPANSTPIKQYSDNGSDAQRWGLTLIKCDHSHYTAAEISIEPTKTTDGERRWICECGDSVIETLPALDYVSIPTGIYTIEEIDEGTYITGSKTDSNVYMHSTENPVTDSQWRFTKNDDGTYSIINVLTGDALGITGESMFGGSRIQMEEFNGSDSQHFFVVNGLEGYELVNYKTFWAVQYPGDYVEQYSWLWQQAYGTVFSDQWTLNVIRLDDTINPSVNLTLSNGVGTSRNITFDMSDNLALAGYYWGTDPDYANNVYTKIEGTPDTFTGTIKVSKGGSYYLTALDNSGNVCTISETFYETSLNGNGGTTKSYISVAGESFEFPTPTRYNYTFIEWNAQKDGNGMKYEGTYQPECDKTFYAQWEYYSKILGATSLVGYSVSLSDRYSLIFYFDCDSDEFPGDSMIAKAGINVFDSESDELHFRYDLWKEYNGRKCYGIEVPVDPKYVYDSVYLKLYDSEGKEGPQMYYYTIAGYCSQLTGDGYTTTSPYADIAKKIVNYGALAQRYFGYPDSSISMPPQYGDVMSTDKEVLKRIRPYVSYTGMLPKGVDFIGISLVLDSSIKYRAYFDFEDITVLEEMMEQSDNENTLIFDAKSGLYYIEKDTISIVDFGNNFTFQLGDWQITSNPLYYIDLVLSGSSKPALRSLCIALFDYYEAAIEIDS